MWGKRWTLVAGMVGAVLCAPAASADPVPYPATRYPQELTFAGSRLLWTDLDGRLRAQDPGGPPRVLFTPRRSGGGMFPEVEQIAADASRIAFVAGTQLDEDGEMWESLRVGPLDGPFGLLVGSETASLEPPLYDSAAVYDGGVMWMSLVDGASQVTLHPDAGPERALFRSTTATSVVAAGGVAAVVSQSDFAERKPPPAAQLDVLDIATGARLYGLALRGAPQAAVAPDGTVLVLQGDALAWASPAAPALHPIARSVDVLGGLGNGTAVFAVRVAGGFDVIRAADLATGVTRDRSPKLTRIDRVRPDVAWDGTHPGLRQRLVRAGGRPPRRDARDDARRDGLPAPAAHNRGEDPPAQARRQDPRPLPGRERRPLRRLRPHHRPDRRPHPRARRQAPRPRRRRGDRS